MAEEQNTTAPNSAGAPDTSGQAKPSKPKPATLKEGGRVRYHYLENGPRRCFCEGTVLAVHKGKKGAPDTFDLEVSMGGKRREIDAVGRYDVGRPNVPGAQALADVPKEAAAQE